ncbi:PaaI family thioesterase [Streptomyces sp. GQFP]|uniref:PaaI family thioesterase n=1 Tax=Streptomyces sp. GQFP TaxID=2907545 RepID=UPI001F376B15|nr:hotdog domain-containing protein [Streptomyces sp. GQFP]UIX29295.1 PaaI family thioesterase [Streptomyces sp. GQFP]
MSHAPVEDGQTGSATAWTVRPATQGPDAQAFGALVEAVRRLQSAVVTAAPPAAVTADLLGSLRRTVERLEQYEVLEDERFVAAAVLFGPGHPLLVRYSLGAMDDRSLRATVTFGAEHVGGNGAVHGGFLPLLFDDLLGTFVSTQGQPGSRTAFLTVNYRKITPVHRELQLDATIDRIDGRKTFVSGRLREGEDLLADAEALFVQLRPGQP